MSEQIARAVAVAAAAEPTAQSNRIEQMFGAVMAAAGTALSPQSILSITTARVVGGFLLPGSDSAASPRGFLTRQPRSRNWGSLWALASL